MSDSCAHCGDPLGDSPSEWFCQVECQQLWHQAHTANTAPGKKQVAFVPHRDVLPPGPSPVVARAGGAWAAHGRGHDAGMDVEAA